MLHVTNYTLITTCLTPYSKFKSWLMWICLSQSHAKSVSLYLLRSRLVSLQYYTVSDLFTKMRSTSWPHVHSVIQIEKQFALNDNAKRRLMIIVSRSKCSFVTVGSYCENCKDNSLPHTLFRICINFQIHFTGDINMATFLTFCLICDKTMNNIENFFVNTLVKFKANLKILPSVIFIFSLIEVTI